MKVICYLGNSPVKCSWYKVFPEGQGITAKSALAEHLISEHSGQELLSTFEHYYSLVMKYSKEAGYPKITET